MGSKIILRIDSCAGGVEVSIPHFGTLHHIGSLSGYGVHLELSLFVTRSKYLQTKTNIKVNNSICQDPKRMVNFNGTKKKFRSCKIVQFLRNQKNQYFKNMLF